MDFRTLGGFRTSRDELRVAKPRYAHAIAILVVLLASGCDWRDFDNLKGRTPVARVPAPSGFPASDSWGDVLAAVTPPGDDKVAARFVAAAAELVAVGVVSFDSFGHASGQNVTGGGLDLLELDQAITAIADVPSSKSVLLGAPTLNRGNLLLLDLEPPYPVTSFFTSVEPQFGAGVAAGQLGGGPADDLVALSENTLHVWIDGLTNANDVYYTATGPSDPCPITLSSSLERPFRKNRAVVIGRFTGGAMQIAVGTPSTSASTPGTVSIFDVDTAAGRATCALKLTGSEARFGQSIAVGNFDGGAADLLVGAPPARAYLYHGPVTATPSAMVMGSPAVAFGTSVAALDVDGDGNDEALISDPEATVGSTTSAGNVTIFKGPTLGTRVMPTPAVSLLSAHDAKEGGRYGTTVRAMPFCPTTGGADGGTSGCVNLPLVGESTGVFAYFTLGKTDPRAK
jgi:hypothetical protein